MAKPTLEQEEKFRRALDSKEGRLRISMALHQFLKEAKACYCNVRYQRAEGLRVHKLGEKDG